MSEAIKNITIIGNQTETWMTAILLFRALQGRCKITVIDNQEVSEPATFEVSAYFFEIHKRFGINLKPVSQPENSVLFAATQIISGQAADKSVWLSHDVALPQYKGIELPHITSFLNLPTENYSPSIYLAKHNKMLAPKQFNPVLGRYEPGGQINGEVYLNFLKEAAKFVGISSIHAAVTNVNFDSESGQVRQLVLSDGQTLDCQLVINTSYQTRQLLNQTQAFDKGTQNKAIQNTDTANKLAFSRCDQFIVENVAPAKHSKTIRRVGHSVLSQTQFLNKTVLSFYSNDDSGLNPDVQQYLQTHYPESNQVYQHMQMPLPAEPIWQANWLDFSSFRFTLSPYYPASTLLLRGVMRLLELFPGADFEVSNTQLFNQQYHLDITGFSEYQALFNYTVNLMFSDESSQLSEQNQHRLALFTSSGKVSHELNPMISRENWRNLLMCASQNQFGFDPVLQALDPKAMNQWLHQLIQKISHL